MFSVSCLYKKKVLLHFHIEKRIIYTFVFILFWYLDIIIIICTLVGLGGSLVLLSLLAMAAAFTCTSLPPLSLRCSETRIASSPSASLSARRLFAVSPESGGLRIRLSQSLTSIKPRVPRLRIGGGVVCEAQETTTDSMFSLITCSIWFRLNRFWA